MKVRIIQIVLAALLFLCLAPMPYGYYELVRFVAMSGFVFLGYQFYKEKNEALCFVYLSLALLFQPFIKIALSREIWLMVDVVVAIFLVISVLFTAKLVNKYPVS